MNLNQNINYRYRKRPLITPGKGFSLPPPIALSVSAQISCSVSFLYFYCLCPVCSAIVTVSGIGKQIHPPVFFDVATLSSYFGVLCIRLSLSRLLIPWRCIILTGKERCPPLETSSEDHLRALQLKKGWKLLTVNVWLICYKWLWGPCKVFLLFLQWSLIGRIVLLSVMSPSPLLSLPECLKQPCSGLSSSQQSDFSVSVCSYWGGCCPLGDK